MKRVMIDTNVIISAIINPNGTAAKATLKALTYPYEPVICGYIIEELYRKFEEKFSHRADDLEMFLEDALKVIRLVDDYKQESEDELKIRDIKDRPILRAAKSSKTRYLLTGDRDFLESGICEPEIISPADFLKLK